MSHTETPDVAEHYNQHKPVYDDIADRLQSITDHFANASRPKQKMMLNKAVSFALISAQTQVKNHEQGYLRALEATSWEEIESALLEGGVNYYKNKAHYIFYNLSEPDYDAILDEYEAGNIDKMHRLVADQCMGVSTRKSAYALAKSVTTEKMCIDTHVAQFMNLEPDEIYTGVVIDRYEDQCRQFLDMIPSELDHFDPFMKQWIAFDAQRDTVTTHDCWFMSLDVPSVAP